VQVWGKLADDNDSSEAIHWLHRPYQEKDARARIDELSIKRSSVTGQVGQIGRLWHRMYPVVRISTDPNDATKKIIKKTRQYMELLTIFPNDFKECTDFLDFLVDRQQFEQLWGKPWEEIE
jgi:CRISPR-associated protein Cmr6